MAREYPRFLYSNPTNTKSKGPFVFHTEFPLAIFRMEDDGGSTGWYFDEATDEESFRLQNEAEDWYRFQIKHGFIQH